MTSQPDRSRTDHALNQLLQVLAPGQAQQTAAMAGDPGARLTRCIELLKAQVSEAASLIADCVPHGRQMLTESQHKLECLESLKQLEIAATASQKPAEKILENT
ncbi:MAG: hypothetical protein VX481_03505 [Cyanobacteriota bacterium]|nr:hypothetical protein [Cyanobacteriota bacterium]